MHLFSLQFLYDVVDKHLKQAHLRCASIFFHKPLLLNSPLLLFSYHLAKKKIPTVNDLGEKFTPKDPNGWKFELFVFDVFPFASNMCALEVRGDDAYLTSLSLC
jgi:UDP-N-acetylglucosamine pyrophosphorylase